MNWIFWELKRYFAFHSLSYPYMMAGKPSCRKIWIFKSPNVMLWVLSASLGPLSLGFASHIFPCRCPCISGARSESSVVCFSRWFTTNTAVSNPKLYHMFQCVHELGRSGLIKDLSWSFASTLSIKQHQVNCVVGAASPIRTISWSH